ncbi:threonine synthase [Glaciibacter superstes]|uniref:threonine synthase n=1 Tax=Glaciibacter superstes TaxID=501023 RepID=UPI0003B51501|nr:threonine synthase [Glaciibacter superstes]
MPEQFSYLTELEESGSGVRSSSDEVRNLGSDGTPLLARYDLDTVRSAVTPAIIAERKPTLWRYHELLPVRDPAFIRGFGEGMTPLVELPRLGASLGVPRLKVKDESALPTGSFKARGAAVGVARAAELGITRLAMPTNGNAGAAWAAYCAQYGIEATVIMPVDAPAITRSECVMAGARVALIDGLISDAGRVVGELTRSGDIFDASTLKEPYRVEGKKTMGLELIEQLGWKVPDVIVYPTGGGVGLIGIYKAILELQKLGWIGAKLPRLVSVQAAGCDPIVQAFTSGASDVTPQTDTRTVAFGINVPKPLGGRAVLEAVRATEGTAIAVSDSDILNFIEKCASSEGMMFCPEGAATLVAVAELRGSDWIDAQDEVVVLNTGAGNKYPEAVAVDLPTVARDAGTDEVLAAFQ